MRGEQLNDLRILRQEFGAFDCRANGPRDFRFECGSRLQKRGYFAGRCGTGSLWSTPHPTQPADDAEHSEQRDRPNRPLSGAGMPARQGSLVAVWRPAAPGNICPRIAALIIGVRRSLWQFFGSTFRSMQTYRTPLQNTACRPQVYIERCRPIDRPNKTGVSTYALIR